VTHSVAAEWKMLFLYHIPGLLYGILPAPGFASLMNFVLAIRLLLGKITEQVLQDGNVQLPDLTEVVLTLCQSPSKASGFSCSMASSLYHECTLCISFGGLCPPSWPTLDILGLPF
jgi:hypothetical protein